MTLIELMVGIAVVAIIVMAAMPGFSTWTRNREIRTAAESIQNGLQLARSEALRRNRGVKFSLGTDSGWQVSCDQADTNMGDDGQQNCPETPLQSRDPKEGSANVAIATAQTAAVDGAPATSPVFAGSITFTPLGRVALASLPAGNFANFGVSHRAGGTCAAAGGEMRCLSIVVSPAGQIRMCDPAALSGNSRAC